MGGGRLQDVLNIVIWLGKFWYFGKLVAEERWLQLEVCHIQHCWIISGVGIKFPHKRSARCFSISWYFQLHVDYSAKLTEKRAKVLYRGERGSGTNQAGSCYLRHLQVCWTVGWSSGLRDSNECLDESHYLHIAYLHIASLHPVV